MLPPGSSARSRLCPKPPARLAVALLWSRLLPCLLALSVLGLAACGSSGKDIDTAAYTCAQFNKSLRTKGDNSSGRYIDNLRKQAKLGQNAKTERSEITLGIYFGCKGKPGSTKPAAVAIATAKQIKAGKFSIPKQPKSTTTKTSSG